MEVESEAQRKSYSELVPASADVKMSSVEFASKIVIENFCIIM